MPKPAAEFSTLAMTTSIDCEVRMSAQVIGDDPAACVAEDVADKKKFHLGCDVTAPFDAEPTSATYFANTPVL